MRFIVPLIMAVHFWSSRKQQNPNYYHTVFMAAERVFFISTTIHPWH